MSPSCCRIAIAGALTLCMTVTVVAADSLGTAINLGNLLASDSVCNLSFSEEAVSDFIVKNVPADDMEFAGYLQLYTDTGRRKLERMDELSRAAHCTQARRVAEHYGLLN